MIRFNCDYAEGAHESILRALAQTNFEQNEGYGTDAHCRRAADLLRALCEDETLAVHFLVGGTQANMTVIDAALRPHQGVLSADTGHINGHETGAVEATGHKVLALPNANGKITAAQVEDAWREQAENESAEHLVQPKMVYVSHPTELGTLYTKAELEALHRVCRAHGLYLFLDGARLAYGLAAAGADVTLPDLARLCDVFYAGGTKAGALFGEAVVIANEELKRDFRYAIKQHGGMLAKGWLLGIQFEQLFQNGLYQALGRHADKEADRLRAALARLGVPLLVQNTTNQLFPILPDTALDALRREFTFTYQCRVDEARSAVRFCTSWATRPEHVDALIAALEQALKA